MEQEPVYNLLQAIDPSKIKVPISERFSKLTLSSNKKKKEQLEAPSRLNEVKELRDRASRSLLKELSQQIDEDNSSAVSSNLEKPLNPLLCSDSSRDQSNYREKSHLGEYYETTMDSLNVTEDESDLSGDLQSLDVDLLSQKVSALSVVCRPTAPSGSSGNVTQLVSTESQRSSMGDIQRFHNIEEIPVKITKREILVTTSSTSSSISDGDQMGVLPTYEITDDEEEILQNELDNKNENEDQDKEEEDEGEEEETDDEVITISDSSESHLVDDQQTQMQMGISASEVLEAGEKTLSEFRNMMNLPLPSLSPNKMDRMTAFLRDVSFDQRQRQENGYEEKEDSICNYNLPPEEKEKLIKANKLKTADTESMTPEDEKGEKEKTPESLRERQRRLKALEDKEENFEAQDQTPKNRERRLVSADTVENTITSEEEDMDLQVTPTQRAIVEVSKNETEVKKLMDHLSDLNLKTPQTLKRNDNKYENVMDLKYISPGRQKNLRRMETAETEPNTLIEYEVLSSKTLQNIESQENTLRPRRIESVETEANTLIEDGQISPLKLPKTFEKSGKALGENSLRSPLRPRRIESVETEANTLIEDGQMSPLKLPKTLQKTGKALGENSPRSPLRPRRIESAETEPNTIVADESLSPLKSYKTPQKPLRNLATAETQENTLCLYDQIYSPKSSARRGERRLVSADTEENTMSDLQLSNSTNSLITPQIYKEEKNVSIPSSPVYKTPQKHNLNTSCSTSLHSIISSSNGEEINDSAPENSITILETDDETQNDNQTPSESPQPQENNKLSNSFQEVETDSQQSSASMTQIQMSMANINISAKINIKITIPDCDTTSDEDNDGDNNDEDNDGDNNDEDNDGDNNDEDNDGDNNDEDNDGDNNDDDNNDENNEEEEVISKGNSLPESLRPSLESNKSSEQNSDKNSEIKEIEEEIVISASNEEIVLDSEKSETEDEKFVDTAAKLLTQLYGNAWQTPDVLKNLRKSKENEEKKLKFNETPKITKSKTKNTKEEKITAPKNGKEGEDSVLGDFSMFRHQIVKTHGLDSTRLLTPKPKSTKTKEFRTEPRKRLEKNSEFIKPQTESCRRPLRRPMARVNTQEIRKQNEIWRQLIDSGSDSECNNASDDEDADKSDESWKEREEEASNDRDFVISPKKTKTKGNKNTDETKGNKKIDQTKSIKKEKESFNDEEKEKENDNDNDNNTNKKKTVNANKRTEKRNLEKSTDDDIIYLDLSKEEVEVQEDVPQSPPANHDVTFASKLNEILMTCRHEDKPKLPSSAQSTKSKRKLFTPIFDHDFDANIEPNFEDTEVEKKDKRQLALSKENDILIDDGVCPFDNRAKPKKLELFNKNLEAIKIGKPIFPITPSPKKVLTPNRKFLKEKISASTTKSKNKNETPSNKLSDPLECEITKNLERINITPQYKYSFLKSLDATVSNTFCHPDARIYRDNYRLKKEELSRILYDLYNEKLFKNNLNVPLTWNKKLSNTAGRCLNKKKLGVRSSVVELSEKVLTSADRLRCTLIHELCHAATWIFNGEGGHGRTWKEWAFRANVIFPELPKIGVCHQYEIEYKYTYKCTLCAAKSHAHSKSKKVENIRCSYCHGAIEIFLNKKDKEGNIMPTPVKEATGFAKFVKDNYKKYKNDNLKHADVMRILSGEFAALKVQK